MPQRPRSMLVCLLFIELVMVCTAVAESEAANNQVVTAARCNARAAERNLEKPAALTKPQETMLNRYVSAFESYDVSGLMTLMQLEVTFCMPPYSLWVQGPKEVSTWMLGLGSGYRGSRLIPTAACGWPAFAQYRPAAEGRHMAWALIVLELAGDRITGVNNFLDVEHLFPRFGLPLQLS